ncbi:MAG: hypothetical protein LQ340_000884 [Diploschistes diacapsis]|nr:MAG: hypothetical protein LQ340_000884 [Diploschistes diacapsis]
MAPDPQKSGFLAAHYRNGKETENWEFRHSLDAITADAPTEERVNYLSSLRSSVTALQEEINIFLTKKMEEDKASPGKSQGEDERTEEENYGEEVVEET